MPAPLTLLVATRNRPEKLKRMVESVPVYPWLEVFIVLDGECLSGGPPDWILNRSNLAIMELPSRVGSVDARNRGIKDTHSNILYGTDDVTFREGMIESAYDDFERSFPDTDGVLGLRQDKSHHPTGMAIVGKKFLDRYPDRQLFNPEYDHFAAQEIHWLAVKLGKFATSREVVVEHYHPCFCKEEMDETHREARIHKERDMKIMKARKEGGLIWGM